jgi:hypothetical protein
MCIHVKKGTVCYSRYLYMKVKGVLKNLKTGIIPIYEIFTIKYD